MGINIKYKLLNSCGRCPECGSMNTGQSTYTDYCNDCDWRVVY